LKVYTLDYTQDLPISVSEAWGFFSNPGNLARITPPDLRLEVTSPLPSEMHAGLIITYTVRPLLNVPISWVTEITHVIEKRLFVDEQRLGPYKIWHHVHQFEEIHGGVRMRDTVSYVLSFDPLSRPVNALIVAPRLIDIFNYRRKATTKLFSVQNP
jgi:ligand-binding SRPBCC domain-containing protein